MRRFLFFLNFICSGALACYLFPYNTVHIDIDPTILGDHSEILTVVENYYAEYSCSFDQEVEHSFNKTDGSYLIKRKLCLIECLCETTRKWDYTPDRFMSFQFPTKNFYKVGLKFKIVKLITDPCTFYKTNYWSYYPHYNPDIDYIITKSKRTPSTKPDVFFYQHPNLKKEEPFQEIPDMWDMDIKPDNVTSKRSEKVEQLMRRLAETKAEKEVELARMKLKLSEQQDAEDEADYENWMFASKMMFLIAFLYMLITAMRVINRYFGQKESS